MAKKKKIAARKKKPTAPIPSAAPEISPSDLVASLAQMLDKRLDLIDARIDQRIAAWAEENLMKISDMEMNEAPEGTSEIVETAADEPDDFEFGSVSDAMADDDAPLKDEDSQEEPAL